VGDTQNSRIVKVDTNGFLRTIFFDRTPAFPRGVALDSGGNLYVSETPLHRIRKMDAAGNITTIAGTGTPGYSGDNGPAVKAQLNSPAGIAVDSAGAVYVADSDNNAI